MLVMSKPTLERAYLARDTGYRVGAGCFRDVYRLPGDFWVYKFADRWNTHSNQNEVENVKLYSDKMPPNCFLPQAELISPTIVAMEFIDGILARDIHLTVEECQCLSRGLNQCYMEYTHDIEEIINDAHNGNMIIKDGKVYLIDLGED